MSDQSDTRAELTKLARVLGVDVEALAFLEPIGWQELREFRNLVSDQLFATAESRLKNLAAAAKLVPNPVIIKLAPQYFEPRMAAGLASLMDEDKALKLVPKLPPNLMAQTVPFIDPRRVGPLIGKIPVEVTRRLAPLMLEAKEYIAFGQLIDVVTREQLQGFLPMVDDVALLKIAEVTENKQQFNVMFSLVDDARIGRLFQAAKDADMVDVALDFLREVNYELRVRMVGVAAQQSDSALDALLRAIDSAGEWGTVVGTVKQLNPGGLVRLAQAKALEDDTVMNAVIDSVVGTSQWHAVLPLFPHLSDRALNALAAATAFADRAAVGSIVRDAVEASAFVLVLPLIAEVSDSVRHNFAHEVGALDSSTFERVVQTVIAAERLSEFLPIVPLLPKVQQDQLSAMAARFDPEEMREALVDASENGVLPEMFQIAAGMPLEAREQAVEIINTNADDEDLLGTTLEPEEQQSIWNQVLRLTDNVPAPLIQQLSDRAAFLPLDNILPSILRAGELTNEWQTSFALLSGIQDRAQMEGVSLEFTVPTQLLQAAVAKAGEQANPLSFARTLLSQSPNDMASSAVQISVGFLGDGVAPIRAFAEGASVTEVVADVAGKAGGLASSLFGRAKAAGGAVRRTVEQNKDK